MMNSTVISEKNLNILKLVSTINFNASVVFLLVISVMPFFESSMFIAEESEFYGPMTGNLKLMLIYLCITELAVYSFCRMQKLYQGILTMGVFYLLLMFSVEFYGIINDVPIDENYRWIFLYLGLSHLSYGTLTPLNLKTDD